MYQRLTTFDVTAIERCLAAGMRHAEIARRLDLSLWPIARIADRRRFETDEGVDPSADLPEDDGPPDYQAQNLHRCPSCGAMIYVTPCIACRMANAVPAAMPIENGDVDDDFERL